MQIPILNGIYTDSNGDFRSSYPRNLVPVPKNQGISQGYLKPAEGLKEFGTGPGIDRGGINWNGACFRVMGTKLVKVDFTGVVTTLGDVGGSGQVTFDYSFDRLAVCSSGKFFYWDGLALTQVTDSDLGEVIDFVWVDGYFMTTDGANLVVTELTDPLSVNPIKYGSSEADPDPVKALLKLANEPCAINRYTIEVFDNIGGALFPFRRIEGAQIQRGAIGTYAAAVFANSIAFVGSGRNEAPAVWLAANGNSVRISTREIDVVLSEYTEDELSLTVVETRIDKGHQHLLIHLPNKTLVYDANASIVLKEPVWFSLDSGLVEPEQYRARNIVRCFDSWICGDPTSNKIGVYAEDVSTHFDTVVGWEFGTVIVYNSGTGCIFHELELVALPGRVAFGVDPSIWTSYSKDGETWSQERAIKSGKQGERNKRLVWLQQGSMNNWRIQKFRGTSDAHMSVARLEARVEALYV